MLAIPEPQEEPDTDTEIDHRPKVLNGVQDYVLVRDKEHRSTKALEIYGYEDFPSDALLTISINPSTF